MFNVQALGQMLHMLLNVTSDKKLRLAGFVPNTYRASLYPCQWTIIIADLDVISDPRFVPNSPLNLANLS